ncbi:MAG: exosome complex RNA-binding protein Csl4 [archaeon]
MEKKIKLVFPGEFLTVEEEYLPGKNTFEEENGRIYSARIGELEFNEKEREVTVKPKKEMKLVDVGTIITGNVLLLKDSMALIKIIKAEKDNEERIPLNSTAILFISNIARGFVKSIRDEFKIGDIVKAKVVTVSPYSIEVTTTFPELGVIKAFCTKCRNSLELYGSDLKCRKCGSVEKRKISSSYA